MGYTHYWREKEPLDAEKFKAFSAACEKLVILAQSQGIKFADAMGESGDPEFTDTIVAFNGLGDESHESFVIDTKFSDFEFCKTARKPYDVAVVACLIAFKKHFGDVVAVSSDGDDDEWQRGKMFCQTLFGYGDEFTFNEDGKLTESAKEAK